MDRAGELEPYESCGTGGKKNHEEERKVQTHQRVHREHTKDSALMFIVKPEKRNEQEGGV